MIRATKVALAIALAAAMLLLLVAMATISHAGDPNRADIIASCMRTASGVVADTRTTMESTLIELTSATNQGLHSPDLVAKAKAAQVELDQANTSYQDALRRSLADPGAFASTCKGDTAP